MTEHSARARASRARQLITATALFATAFALAGCGGAAPPPAAGAPGGSTDERFDQSLHDLLPESIRSQGVVSFGGLWETPPGLGVDPADPTKPAGIAPELVAHFGEILGVDVEWQNLQWPAQLPGLQAGSVDVLFGQVSITEERELSIVDLIPWGVNRLSLLLPADNPHDVESFSELCGRTISVGLGSNQIPNILAVSDEDCVGAGKPAIKLAEYQGAAPAIQALRAGTVDAWIDGQPEIEKVVESEPEVFSSVLIPEDQAPPEYSGIAIPKENPGLAEAIAGAMKILIEDGTYQEILDSHGSVRQALTAEELVINPITGTPVGKVAG